MGKNELAVVSSFQIVTGFEGLDEELMEELKEEMNDLDEERGIACRQIKIPSGGGKAFEVESDDPDDPEVVKEVTGVIIFTHRMNSYWEGDFGSSDDGNRAPTCSSIDAKQGMDLQTGEVKDCENCIYNQFSPDGSGKPCKNMRRIYLMMSGKPGVYMISVPPTSLKDINRQLTRIMGTQKVPYTRMVVTFKLEKAKNKGGIEYSKVIVEKTGMLPPELCSQTAEMRRQLKEKYKEVAITSADFNAATVDGTAFETAEEVPFNN